jgi:uncharacterized protein (TIGR02217 family)
MATFPEDPIPDYPLIISPRFKTVSTGFDSGREERTRLWLFPKYDVQVPYTELSSTDAQTLWNFFLARSGSYEAFYIYDLSLLAGVTKSHVGQYVGTGDGSTVTFDLPGRSTSSQTIYANGSTESSSDYTLSYGGGASSADQVTFDSAPAAGAVITADFSGYLRMRVKFAQDTISQELFAYNLFNFGIQLTGLAAA